MVLEINESAIIGGGILLALGWVGMGVRSTLRAVRETNGAVAKLMTWKDDHNKQDDARHTELLTWQQKIEGWFQLRRSGDRRDVG